ncbi:MAG: hypothetical protein HQ464_05850 [Planctomycetes bacterium]|nr:hypothetical protein [Planctomycetota bacterium]
MVPPSGSLSLATTSFRSMPLVLAALLAAGGAAWADEATQPKTIPQTRQTMLEALDALKARTPRIPLPPPVARTAEPTGPLGVVNNGLMRTHYLPAELRSAGPQRQPDPALKLDSQFAVELFWIVSRVNNCHYCLGHQEAKLATAGMTEEGLLALDTDWKFFPLEQQAAFAFARKLTSAPQAVTAADIDSLRPHFEPTQILGIVLLVARYNSTNRWTDSLGIPQEDHREFRSQLPAEEQQRPSQVTMSGFPPRAGFHDFAAWKSAFDRAATRVSRLPLAEPAAVESILAAGGGKSSPREYERLLANFPVAGGPWIGQVRAAESVGELPNDLKEKIAMVSARADQAWYMQHRARRALVARGLDERQIFALGASADASPAESAALAFAKKLTLDPQAMTDADIGALLAHFTAKQSAEIVYHVGLAAFLDRLTEAAGLGWAAEQP